MTAAGTQETPNLGPRQAQVLDLLEQGKTAREIAWMCELSTARVYKILSVLRRKGLIDA